MIPIPTALLRRQIWQGTLQGPSASAEETGKQLVSIKLPMEYARPWNITFFSPGMAAGGDPTVSRLGDALVLAATPVNGPTSQNAVVFLIMGQEVIPLDYPARGAVYQITTNDFQLAVKDKTAGVGDTTASYTVSVTESGDSRAAPPTIERPHRTVTHADLPFGSVMFGTIPRRAIGLMTFFNDSANGAITALFRFFSGGGVQIATAFIANNSARFVHDVAVPMPIPAGAISYSVQNAGAAGSWIAPKMVFFLSI